MYCTKTDLLERVSNSDLIQWTQDDPGAGSPDDTKINTAIASADGVIDSYLSLRYDIPVQSPPDRVKNLSVDISIYNLFTLRPHSYSDDDVIVRRYTDSMKFLKDVAAGKATIGELPQPSASELTGGSMTGNDRTFSRESMEGF